MSQEALAKFLLVFIWRILNKEFDLKSLIKTRPEIWKKFPGTRCKDLYLCAGIIISLCDVVSCDDIVMFLC